MIMQYWSKMKGMDSWHYAVPETSAKVFDPGWPGTGNWSFNVAHAGGHDGLRSWVCRLASLDSLIHLLRLGVPVAASVSADLLKGKATKGDNDGHLVVVSGWDQSQHVIVNDPAKCPMVRTKCPCKCFHERLECIPSDCLHHPTQWTEHARGVDRNPVDGFCFNLFPLFCFFRSTACFAINSSTHPATSL